MPLNAYCTLRQVEPPDFPVRRLNVRDRHDPALARHLSDFAGYLTRDGRVDQARYHLVQHVLRTRHQLSFEVDDENRDAFARWLRWSNGVCFFEPGSVRDPEGRLLFDPGSDEADPQARLPYPPDSEARRQAVMADLAGRGIEPFRGLPPVLSEREVVFRRASDVARRALSLTAVAIRGESLVGAPLSVKDLRRRFPLAFDNLTPKETALMSDGKLFSPGPRPDQAAAMQAVWRYEAAATLFWALGMYSLPFPSGAISASDLVQFVVSLDAEPFVAAAELRPAGEILSELDRDYRLHWIAVDDIQNGRETSAGFDPDVVSERHYALNWLVSVEDVAWDDVTTPT